MGTTASVIRAILVVDSVAMALLALVFLRQRRMNWTAFVGWGLLAMCLPVLGPFLVLSRHPGEWNPNFTFSGEVKRLSNGLKRLLPGTPDRDLPRLERLRRRRKARK
jgi:hypothetical protein